MTTIWRENKQSNLRTYAFVNFTRISKCLRIKLKCTILCIRIKRLASPLFKIKWRFVELLISRCNNNTTHSIFLEKIKENFSFAGQEISQQNNWRRNLFLFRKLLLLLLLQSIINRLFLRIVDVKLGKEGIKIPGNSSLILGGKRGSAKLRRIVSKLKALFAKRWAGKFSHNLSHVFACQDMSSLHQQKDATTTQNWSCYSKKESGSCLVVTLPGNAEQLAVSI